MDSLFLDLRFAARSLRRRRSFTAIAIVTIALATGASTSIYSVVDGVLFRSLPYRDAGRLVAVWQTDTARRAQAIISANWDRVPLDYTDFLTWRERQTSFSAVAVWSGFGAMMPGARGPEQIIGTRVSPGLFELLGVRPLLGRTFLPGEDVVGGPRVTMISYEVWKSRYGGRDDVVGSLVRLDDVPYEIVGVLPEGFTLQRGKPGAPYWIPAGQQVGDIGRRNRSFLAIARLRPGATLEQATIETTHLLDASLPVPSHGVRIADLVSDETRTVRGQGALQRFMIGAEVTLTVVLLVGAGLLTRSLSKLSAVEPGFRPANLLAVRISYPDPRRDSVRLRGFYAEALARLRREPGVAAATAASNVPFTGGSSSSPYLLEGEGEEARVAHRHEVQQRVVAADYFATMGIPLIAGRTFTDDDRAGAPLVAVISEAAARRDFPFASAIGKRVHYQGAWREIVGVVRDAKYDRLSREDQPSIYTPAAQRLNVLDIVVRTAGDPAALVPRVRDVVQQAGPNVAITDVQIVESLLHGSYAEERFRTALIALFAAMAALLAAVGTYGVTARDPGTYGAVLLLLTGTTLLASWLPARRAGRVSPAVVLRHE